MLSLLLRVTGAVSAILAVACAPEFPPTLDDCRVGELVDRGRVAGPFRHEIVFVIDTHGDAPPRAAIASAAAAVVRALGTGDVEGDGDAEFAVVAGDLRVASITSSPACGESPTAVEWVSELGIGGDIDDVAGRVETSIRELPTCGSSSPLATVTRHLALAPAETHPRVVDVVIITDEDEIGIDVPSFLDAARRDERPVRSVSIISPLSGELVSDGPDWDAVLGSTSCIAGTTSASALLRAGRALEDAGLRISLGSLCGDLRVAPLEAMVPTFAEGCADCWCIERPTVPPVGELAPCELIERLGPAGYHAHCAELPGRDPTPLAIDDEGLETCRIIQRSNLETEPGWRLDRAPASCGPEGNHVALIGTALERGSSFELRCVSIPATEGCE